MYFWVIFTSDVVSTSTASACTWVSGTRRSGVYTQAQPERWVSSRESQNNPASRSNMLCRRKKKRSEEEKEEEEEDLKKEKKLKGIA